MEFVGCAVFIAFVAAVVWFGIIRPCLSDDPNDPRWNDSVSPTDKAKGTR